MVGIAEVVLWIVWRVLPQRLRLALATRIAVIQSRSIDAVPRSPVLTLAHTPETAARFPEAKKLYDEPNLLLRARERQRYSLLSTYYNEAHTIEEFLDSILRQTAAPAEVVLVDGGSSDGTAERIIRWKANHPATTFSIEVVSQGRLNISQGRNLAAERAANELLLFTDAGTTLDRHWAERLLEAFEVDPEVEVSMGWYRPISTTSLQAAVAEYVIPRWEAIEPERFLPSARSLALTKSAFLRAGGYPEYLSRAGEDTLFDYFLKSAARRWAFVPDAIAYWKLPEQPQALFRMVSGYAQGDAESPVMFGDYYLGLLATMLRASIELALAILVLPAAISGTNAAQLFLLVLLLSLGLRLSAAVLAYRPSPGSRVPIVQRVAVVLGLMIAQSIGFVRGLRRRSAVEQRRLQACPGGAVIFCTPRALTAWDNQKELAEVRTLLTQGCCVTLVAGQGAPIGDQYFTLYAHPFLEQYVRSVFDAGAWWQHFERIRTPNQPALLVIDRANDGWSRAIATELDVLAGTN